MTTRKALLASAAFAAVSTHSAHAQEAFDLGTLVLSSEYDETTLGRSGATVSVVTREDLERTAETRVADYLARLPGVDVRSRGPLGGLSSVTIRGAGQNYVTVLVDGIEVSDPSTPQVSFDFGALATDDIERIEVLRGGQSALYGSRAVGGVISIRTRRATEEGLSQRAGIEVGSYETLRLNYGLSYLQGPVDYTLNLSRTRSEGFSAADEADGNTEADGFDQRRLSFSAGYDMGEGMRVGLTGFVERAEIEFDEQFPVGDGTPDEVTENTSYGLRAYLEAQTGAVESEFSLSTYRIERNVFGTSGGFVDDNRYVGTRVKAAYLGRTSLGAATDLRFGLDWTEERYEQSGTFGPSDGENRIRGAFAELAYSPAPDVDMVGTLRYDDHSHFGGFWTGRLAGAWRPAPEWVVRGSVARSFRAPSNYELFGPFGDPTLEPEESTSVDLGVERRFGEDGYVSATLFHNETENLIDFPFSSPTYVQVPGTVTRQGIELAAGVPLSAGWRIGGSYTYTDGDNPSLSDGNAWNLEFPAHDLSLTLSGDLTPRLSGALSVQHVADRPTLGDYTVANAALTYDFGDDIEAYLRVENLTDEHYQLVDGYGTAGRSYYVGLRTSF